MKSTTTMNRMAATLVAALLCLSPCHWGQALGDFDIYRVNVQNGEVQRVSYLPGVGNFNPSFSNNGHTIVHEVVFASGFQLLALTDVETGESFVLEGGIGGNDASWSPNGNYIAFDRAPFGDLTIYYVPVGGGIPTPVRAWAVDPEWSPNSQRLVFTDVLDGAAALKTVKVGTEEETLVAPFGLNGSWSPNGNYIAYTDGNSLWKVAVNNAGEPQGAPTQLTDDGPFVYNQQPSWSNDSKTIVFHSNRGGADFDLWTVPADGGMPSLLTGLFDSGDYDPCFSKNGKWVAYAGAGIPPMAMAAPMEEDELAGDPVAILQLGQNYPNPFRETTVISFVLPEPGAIKLQVFDAQGALISTLAAGQFDAGKHQVVWDGQGENAEQLPPGIYTYTLSTDQQVLSGRMIRVNR